MNKEQMEILWNILGQLKNMLYDLDSTVNDSYVPRYRLDEYRMLQDQIDAFEKTINT